MRPADAFGRPRPVPAGTIDAPATNLSPSLGGPVGHVGHVGHVGSVINNTLGRPSTAPMMTYFLVNEDDMDVATQASRQSAEGSKPSPATRAREAKTALLAPSSSSPCTMEPIRATEAADVVPSENGTQPLRPLTPETSHHHDRSAPDPCSPGPPGPSTLSPILSQSNLTSPFNTPGLASISAMSSASSRRNSLSLSSSFVMDDPLSDDEPTPRDERVRPAGSAGSAECGRSSSFFQSPPAHNSTTTGTTPQLVMPSIQMPSRRPFTDAGRRMGRLKVLVAGAAGTGKTSLIKALVQTCPHIVHVDHIASSTQATSRRSSAATATPATPATPAATAIPTPHAAGDDYRAIRGRRRSSRSSRSGLATAQSFEISEIYASTKPYPAWWNESHSTTGPRRRKSLGGTVLDRNICLVDTPGYAQNASRQPREVTTLVTEHLESHLHKLCARPLADADFVSLVRGDGASAVDAVFYLLSNTLQSADVEYLARLASLTNVIPLLARADRFSDVARLEAKEKLARQLHEAGIKTFSFGSPLPYAVSSATGSDHDIMDASLLMSPDYVQPLVPTDLALLVEHVFCPDGVAHLRHAAAQKALQWRKTRSGGGDENDDDDDDENDTQPRPQPRPQALYRPLSLGGELGILTGHPPRAPGSSFALARLADHAQREEHLAQIRLATWAAELQASLDRERAHYETLARSERAIWLTERLAECVQDGTLVAVQAQQAQKQQKMQKMQQAQKMQKQRKTRRSPWSSSLSPASSKLSLPVAVAPEDPLGLLEITAHLRTRCILVLEITGGLGVLGGLAVWAAMHNYHLHLYEWAVEGWTRLWNGET